MTWRWPLVPLLALGAGAAGGYGFARLAGGEPPAVVEACGGTQRMLRVQLSPALEALVDRRRGDRWIVFEAHEVPRPRASRDGSDGGTSEAGP